MEDTFFLAILIFAAGLLYSSVGHAGASGYLAAMALFGLAPEVMKPTALVLNILVASIAAAQFHRAGCFSWRIFWPFAVSSIPFAFIGGALSLPGSVYKQVLGLILLFAAYRLFQFRHLENADAVKPVPVPNALLFGAGIGLLSGAVGVGGGIFLSPLLLFMGWAIAAALGGVIGSGLGSRRFVNTTLYRLLAVVLVIAGAKLIFV